MAGLGSVLGGAALGSVGSLLGGLFGGKKPKIPELKPIDIAGEQQQAIKQNIAALEPATSLAEKTTAAEQSILEQQLERAIPGYKQLIQQASQNIGAALRGELSPEATRNLQRFSAGQALTRGYGGGSGMGLFDAVQNYARASEARQQQGLGQAMQFIGSQRSAGMVQPMSVSSMFVSPAQRLQLAQQQQQLQYQRDLTAAQVAAQPSPMQQAFGSALSGFAGQVGGMLGQRGANQMAMADYAKYFPQQTPSYTPYSFSFPSTNVGMSYGG